MEASWLTPRRGPDPCSFMDHAQDTEHYPSRKLSKLTGEEVEILRKAKSIKGHFKS